MVAVPTHFFKVVLAERAAGSAAGREAVIGAFVLPNAPLQADLPLTAFSVPLEALEEAAGTPAGLPIEDCPMHRCDAEA